MSVLWTHCPFFVLNVSVLYHRTFPNADPSTWSFYFPLPCYSSLSYQLRKDFTKLIGPDHPLQLNILTSYYHPKFPFIFIWFCDWYLLSPSWWELQWLCLLFFHCFCFQCLAHNLECGECLLNDTKLDVFIVPHILRRKWWLTSLTLNEGLQEQSFISLLLLLLSHFSRVRLCVTP